MGLSNYLANSRISQAGVVPNEAGRPASPYEGQVIYETDTNRTLVWNGTAWAYLSTPQTTEIGTWTSFTPVLWQGSNIACTVEYGKYTVINKTVCVNVFVTATAAGTGSNSIQIRSFPIASSSVSGMTGSARYLDNGTAHYAGTVNGITTTSVGFYTNNSQNLFGLSPAVTVASNDTLQISIVYEAV